MKCGVQSAKCEAGSLKWRVCSVKRGVECEVWSVKCQGSVECEVCSVGCAV